MHNLPHAQTFFSALKLATSLKHREGGTDHNKFNDSYLMGNLASVMVAMFYCYAYIIKSGIQLYLQIVINPNDTMGRGCSSKNLGLGITREVPQILCVNNNP